MLEAKTVIGDFTVIKGNQNRLKSGLPYIIKKDKEPQNINEVFFNIQKPSIYLGEIPYKKKSF